VWVTDWQYVAQDPWIHDVTFSPFQKNDVTFSRYLASDYGC
jgi:hypothetical protein